MTVRSDTMCNVRPVQLGFFCCLGLNMAALFVSGVVLLARKPIMRLCDLVCHRPFFFSIFLLLPSWNVYVGAWHLTTGNAKAVLGRRYGTLVCAEWLALSCHVTARSNVALGARLSSLTV